MSDVNYENLKKNDLVFYARIMPQIKYYEIMELQMVSVYSTYCTGTDLKTKQTYLLKRNKAEEVLFLSERLAIEYLREKKECGGND